MDSNTIELMMSNVTNTPIDLVHQVTCFPGTVWECPYNPAKSIVDQTNNYRKYSHYLSNLFFLKSPTHISAYEKLFVKAINDKKVVFECTCFPGPCHLDALRIKLTKDLEAKGFTVKSNQVNSFSRNKEED